MTSTTTDGRFRLWQRPGWGSAIVEAQLAAYGLDYDLLDAGDLFADADALKQMRVVNPLGQIPALELPSGTVMTESAAITLHLADLTASTLLVPGPDEAERAAFLRWLVFMVANIYPAVSYVDHAAEYAEPGGAARLRALFEGQAARLWRILAAEMPDGAWVLGPRFSALDVFVAVMTRWEPGAAWFAAETPQLAQIAAAVAMRPDMDAVFQRNQT